MSYTNLTTKIAVGGALVASLGACSTFNTAANVNSLPSPTYASGPTATAVVELGACDRLGFKVWEDNPTNRRTLAGAGSLFSAKTVEQYRGHLIEYNDLSMAKTLAVVGAVAGRNSGAGIILGGLVGFAGGNELDKYVAPGKLAELRACKNELDQKPARRDYGQPYGGRIIYNNNDVLGRQIFVPR